MSNRKVLSREQVALLRKVKKAVLAVPNRLAMAVILKKGLTPGEAIFRQIKMLGPEWSAYNPYERADLVPECGTVGCIKGWAKEFDLSLALTINFNWLVSALEWPTKLSKAYSKAKTAKTRAKLAGMAIDYFIEHDGRSEKEVKDAQSK